jgi:hypothetical protein
MTSRRYLLAASGWLALACTLLPPASLERILPTLAFLAIAPGAALVGLRRRLNRSSAAGGEAALLDNAVSENAVLENAVLAVVVSLSAAVLVSEGLFVGHAFTMPRAMLALASLTTVAALAPGRS